MIEGNSRRESLRVFKYEKIPTSAVEGISWNEKLLKNTLDPRLRRFLDADYLLSHTAFFGMGYPAKKEDSPEFVKLQQPDSFRTFSMKFGRGFIGEYGIAYGQINVKGSGLGKTPLLSLRPDEPLGLFGERHAIQDMNVSNLYAEHGARVSRGIAVIKLNHHKLRESLGYDPSSYYDINKNLDIVESNGDNACLYVRLLGSDRHANLSSFSHWNDNPSLFYLERPFTADQMRDRAYKTLMHEYENSPESFQKRYLLSDDLIEAIRDKKDSRLRIIERWFVLGLFNAYFFNYNLGIHDYISRNHFGNQLSVNLSEDNQDITGMWVDFENALPESGQPINTFTKNYERLMPMFMKKKFPLKNLEDNAYSIGYNKAQMFCKGKNAQLYH